MKNRTALITGASSGIGMEFARVLAKKGYSLILTARRKDRLEKLKNELQVPCTIIVADLSKESDCFELCQQISDKKIDIFINNAGFGTCGEFVETNLLKRVLLKMEQRDRGIILNVASSAGLLPAGPYMATYYATKSYVVSLTKAISEELKENGSDVYIGALCPGPVDTEFNDMADVIFALKGISPKYCVREAIMGIKKRKTIIVPSLKMKLAVVGQKALPENMLLKIVAKQQRKKTNR